MAEVAASRRRPDGPGGGVRAAAGDVALGAALAALVVTAAVFAQRGQTALPFSDEASHLQLAVDLSRTLHGRSGLAALALGLFHGSSYPNGLYLPTLPWLEGPTLAEARRGLLLFYAMPAFAAGVAGARVWGRAGAVAYAALVGLTPMALAFARIYFLDVALFGLVGTLVPLVAASEGFRRPGWTIAVALFASWALLTKWTFLGLGGPLLVVTGLRAALAEPGWRRRGLAVLGLVAIGAASAGAVAWLGKSGAGFAWNPGRADWLVPVRLVLGGLGLAGLWAVVARFRPVPPGVSAGLAALVIVLCAGPWYVVQWSALFDRYTLESHGWMQRGGVIDWRASERVLRLLLPGGVWLVPAGVGIAALTRRGGWLVVGLLASVAVAYPATVAGLPYDPRYLLPLAPLLAGVVVAGWGRLPGWIGGPLVLALGAVLAWCSGETLSGHPRAPARDFLGVAVEVGHVGGLEVARLTGPPLGAGNPEALDALIASLRAECATGCTLNVVDSRGFGLQTRALRLLLDVAGVKATVFDQPTKVTHVVFAQCPNVLGAGPEVTDLDWKAPVEVEPGCSLGWRRARTAL